LDAEALDEVAAYDFTYSRYLMSHLQQPERVFKAMVRALRPGGRLAVEDIFFPGHVCYPPNAAFDRYLDLTRPRCVPTAQTRRSVRAWWAWRWMPG
jgi:ubiquinone/menaquinone biosynthesis C-methylase UbiE